MSGIIYLLSAIVLGAVYLAYGIRMWRNHDDLELPMKSFRFSISYLGLLFSALLFDHYFLFQLNLW
jgi:protoheme IX farnesyltransferase